MSLEMGAPIDLARSSQYGAGEFHIRNFIRAYEQVKFGRPPLGDHAPDTRIIREAVGVCALITPWNWPMNQITLKVIPALLAGCTMVLKPSEIAPLSAHIWAEIMPPSRAAAGCVQHGALATGRAWARSYQAIRMWTWSALPGSTRAGIAISKNCRRKH